MPISYHTRTPRTSLKIASKMASNSHSGSCLVGKLFPSGYVSIGRVLLRRISKKDSEYEQNRGKYSYYQLVHWDYQQGIVVENKIREDEAPILGLSAVQNYHKLERGVKRYGLKGITIKGRRTVEEGCYLLERKYGRRLGFYTLTCPYTEDTMVYEFNRNISEIQRRFFQEVRREFERYNMVFSYVSVLEIQASRFESSGVPALHIHYVCPCYVPGTWEFVLTADEIRNLWKRVTEAVCGLSANVEAAVDCTTVKRSAAAYLSKYLSKGGAEIRFLGSVAPSQIPRQWWSVSSSIRKAIRAATVVLPTEVSEYILYGGGSSSDSLLRFLYYRRIYVVINTIDTCVGIAGKLNHESARSLRDFSLIGRACEDL